MNPIRISISISDPWDLGEALGWQPLRGELLQIVEDKHGGRALIKLDDVINDRGSNWRYLVAETHSYGTEIAWILSGEKVACACIGISDQQAASNTPMDTSKWRGGLALTGDVEPMDKPEPASIPPSGMMETVAVFQKLLSRILKIKQQDVEGPNPKF